MAKKKLYTGAGGIIYSTDSNFKPEEKKIEDKTLAPEEQMLKVRLDVRNRGGKIVTLIEGFSGTKDDIEQLGKKIKSFCGTGGSVKDHEIIIQGDNREKILQWLLKMDYKKSRKM